MQFERETSTSAVTSPLAIEQEQASHHVAPVEEDLTAWTQTLMGHFVCFNTWGYIASFGVFQTYYISALNRPASDISWIGSLQVFLIFFVGTFSGRALDMGYFRSFYITGSTIQFLGVFMTSISTKYWQLLLAQGFCTGLGTGLIFCPVTGLVATHFSKHRVFALAFCLAGGSVGGMVFPAVVRELLPRIGFGWTVRVIGFIMLALAIPGLILFKVRLPPRKSGPLIEWSAFKEASYSFFCIGMFLNFWALYFAFYYVGAFGRGVIGLSYSDSVNLIIATNGVGLIGRLIPAYFADRTFGPLNTIIPLTLFTGILMYCWTAVHTTAGIYIFAIMYGMFSNGVQGLFASTLSSLTDDVTKTGVRMGMGFTVVSFACLTGPPLGGALIAQGTGYLAAQIWGGSCFVCGGICLIMARLAKTGNVLVKKV